MEVCVDIFTAVCSIFVRANMDLARRIEILSRVRDANLHDKTRDPHSTKFSHRHHATIW
jgi:hypothetical protein